MATLDDAQRIAAAHGDEGQHAHARVQALLPDLKLARIKRPRRSLKHFPNCAAILPEARMR